MLSFVCTTGEPATDHEERRHTNPEPEDVHQEQEGQEGHGGYVRLPAGHQALQRVRRPLFQPLHALYEPLHDLHGRPGLGRRLPPPPDVCRSRRWIGRWIRRWILKQLPRVTPVAVVPLLPPVAIFSLLVAVALFRILLRHHPEYSIERPQLVNQQHGGGHGLTLHVPRAIRLMNGSGIKFQTSTLC